MANLTESPNWEAGIYQLENTDPVQGGAGGISNRQARELANRTTWLKKQLEQTMFNSGLVSVSSAITLNDTYAGKSIIVTGASDFDITLPLASSMVIGGIAKPLTFVHDVNDNRIFSIRPAGSDIISVFSNATTRVNLKPHTSFTLVPVAGGWYFYGESPLKGVGRIETFASTATPTGYLWCDGRAVSRTTYNDLFGVIGTLFGVGDGSTTFNLPDLRGEFIRGWDNGRGIDSGRIFGGVQLDAFKSHTHLQGSESLFNDFTGGTFVGTRTYPEGPFPSYRGQNTGGAGGNETRPRNVAMLFTIKY